MFFSDKLKKFENIKHCFFSRKNGVSKGYYESLNCGLGSNDKKENVLKNLEFVSKEIGCKKESLITLNQKHSNQVIYFKDKKSVENKLYGDAIISKVKNIGLGILTADCTPILFYDPRKKIIGCAIRSKYTKSNIFNFRYYSVTVELIFYRFLVFKIYNLIAMFLI
jgi:hypothetical protein